MYYHTDKLNALLRTTQLSKSYNVNLNSNMPGLKISTVMEWVSRAFAQGKYS